MSSAFFSIVFFVFNFLVTFYVNGLPHFAFICLLPANKACFLKGFKLYSPIVIPSTSM